MRLYSIVHLDGLTEDQTVIDPRTVEDIWPGEEFEEPTCLFLRMTADDSLEPTIIGMPPGPRPRRSP